MVLIEYNNLEAGLFQVANIINTKVLQNILKPKDPKFKTVDDVLEYAVENYSKLDEMFEFISDQLGIYLEFDKETLIEMVNSTYEDMRSKMMNIQLFETVPFWWIVFPNKERLIEFLRAKVYKVASDMAKEMAVEDEKMKSDLDFTLPQLIASIRSGMSIVPTNNPEQILNILEKALYGQYFNEDLDVSTIQTHLDATAPVESWNDELLKDIVETIKSNPELNDSLFKLGETLKNIRKSVKEATSPTLQELTKHVNKAINNIDKHFNMLMELKNKEPTPEDGFKMYENLYELNNELSSINEILNQLKNMAPEIEQRIRQQLAQTLKNFMNEIQQHFQQIQPIQHKVQNTPSPTQQSQQLNNTEIKVPHITNNLNNKTKGQNTTITQTQELSEDTTLMNMIMTIKDMVNRIKKLSGSKRKILESNLILMIDNVLKMNPPQNIVKILDEIKKEVVL